MERTNFKPIQGHSRIDYPGIWIGSAALLGLGFYGLWGAWIGATLAAWMIFAED